MADNFMALDELLDNVSSERDGLADDVAYLHSRLAEISGLLSDTCVVLERSADEADSHRVSIAPGRFWYHQGERDAYRRALAMVDALREYCFD